MILYEVFVFNLYNYFKLRFIIFLLFVFNKIFLFFEILVMLLSVFFFFIENCEIGKVVYFIFIMC